jgi:ABC-type polysaccharide/polyol phosphate export permease
MRRKPNPIRSISHERRIWSHLGWRDLKVRYVRTLLGPWWSTVALLSIVFGSSVAVGLLGNSSAWSKLPSMAMSMMTWMFVSSVLIEGADVFNVDRSILLNTRIDENSVLARVVWRNYLILLHNFPMVVLVILFVSHSVSWEIFLVLPMTWIFGASLMLPMLLMSRIATSKRDLAVLVPSIIQFGFFITPVIWEPPHDGSLRILFNLNPIGWIIEINRGLGLRGDVDGGLVILLLLYVMVSLLFFIRFQSIVVGVRKLI